MAMGQISEIKVFDLYDRELEELSTTVYYDTIIVDRDTAT
jgi:hypothetical protein